MINFKETLNKELNYIIPTRSVDHIISKTKQNKNRISYIPRLVAAAIVLILLVGICFYPSDKTPNSGFVITAGAQELTENDFVVINSDVSNYIKFNFNYVLDENSHPTDATKRYLFYSFEKNFDLKIVGNDIDTITYKINKGSLTAYNYTPTGDGGSITQLKNTYGKVATQFTIDYNEQDNWTFAINSTSPNNDFYYRYANYLVLAKTGELITDNKFKSEKHSTPIAYGYKDNNTPLATEEEIKTLRTYISENDMTGFYNFQNSIFKRILDEITIDITITKLDGSTDTKTLQLCYTPTEVISSTQPSTNHSYTLSVGTLSAKIKSD